MQLTFFFNSYLLSMGIEVALKLPKCVQRPVWIITDIEQLTFEFELIFNFFLSPCVSNA